MEVRDRRRGLDPEVLTNNTKDEHAEAPTEVLLNAEKVEQLDTQAKDDLANDDDTFSEKPAWWWLAQL